MQLSNNFTSEEFTCKCGCGFDRIDIELVYVLQRLRDHLGKGVRVDSGCRCKEWNKKVGGVDTSQHLLGTASDIVIEGVEPKLVYEALDRWYPKSYGIGLYPSFVHIDIRSNKARWDFS